jgi:hypothetical protein
MRKYVLLIILTIFLRSHTEAQISNNASGNAISNNYGSITYSIGELFYVEKGSQYTLAEGIQNGITINPINTKSSIKVSIYPNPTSDLVYFKVQNLNFHNYSYKIYNSYGIELLHGRIQNMNASASLSHLPPSIYLCKIYRDQFEILTYQIIKIN